MRLSVWILLLFYAFVGPAHSEELVMEFKGLDLIANIEQPEGKNIRSSTVLVLLHDSLSSSNAPLIAGMQARLAALGVISLGINLSYTLDQRSQPYDCRIEQNHRHQDAFEELAVWIKWLKKQKAKRIVLVGHGRGANQIAMYLREFPKSSVKKAVLISPLAGAYARIEAEYQTHFQTPLRGVLSKAQNMIAEEEGEMLMENVGFLRCENAVVTARTFENYYAPNPDYETTSILSSLNSKVSTLTLMGEYDPATPEIQTNLSLLGSGGNIQTAIIPGAGKNFEGEYLYALVEKIAAFIGGVKMVGQPN